MEHIAQSANEIGIRLRMLRKLADLKRQELASLADVSKASITIWERGKIDSPIKAKSMAKLLEAFRKVELEVKERWLRYGTGEPPIYKGKPVSTSELSQNIKPPLIKEDREEIFEEDVSTQLAAILSEEIRLFTSLKQAVIVKIEHSSFEPFLKKGDMVGGIWQSSFYLHEEKLCIIKHNHQLRVARIKKSTKEGLFDVCYSATDNLLIDEIVEIHDQPLEKLAPIIRIWR